MISAAPTGFAGRDARLERVLGAAPRLALVAEADAHEGPVYAADEDALYFTSVPRRPAGGRPRVAIGRLQLDGARFPVGPGAIATVRPDANAANGMAMDAEGRLIVCEQGSMEAPARIARMDRAGREVETLVRSCGGRRLSSPNDVVVASDGAVWFTDPSYGHLQGFRPPPEAGDAVYRHEPWSGRTEVVADSLDKPNGLALAPGERVLYVADSGADQGGDGLRLDRPHGVVAFDVTGGAPARGRPLATTPGAPDGIVADAEGRLYVCCAVGVQVLAPEGDVLGEIRLPGAVNLTFGGPEGTVLFITADTGIWAAVLAAKGA
ncbi:MAG TPA: SMP-30/gluconolactonase/LRE family protein [Miltoncostaeaceae bacterium]|nr:SMP-30/gluconolactonase/LRE family protein [Miltoncostaeaceae bacterium]